MKKILSIIALGAAVMAASAQQFGDTITLTYKLHGQTRKFATVFTEEKDGGVKMDWSIVRNLKLWEGSYTMLPGSVARGNRVSYLMPEDGNHVVLPAGETFAMLSRESFDSLAAGYTAIINGAKWTPSLQRTNTTLEAVSDEGAKMSVALTPGFPLIISMQNNPLEINWTASWKAVYDRQAMKEVYENPDKSGGIYYAYPYSDDVMLEIPDGYKVSHMSHYGRHGSRWVIRDYEYNILIDTLSSRQLTPYGEDVLRRVKLLADHAKGHKGELTPLGERQHRGIAERMYRRFPELFVDSTAIQAYSSTEPRCIISMAAFSERLKELNPALQISRHASPGDMRFISYSNSDAKAVNDSASVWWGELLAHRESVLNPERLMKSIFIDPVDYKSGVYLAMLLHDIAVDTQDAEPGVELLDIFTLDELYALWQSLNYKMYYLHGNNPKTDCAGPRSADNLVNHFVADIDSAVAGGVQPVTLRFGHDTALLRLLARMGVEGADAVVDNPDDYSKRWVDFSLTPMAGNLQVILLTSDKVDSEPLVIFRLNERPVALTALKSDYPEMIYPWSAVKRSLDTFNFDR